LAEAVPLVGVTPAGQCREPHRERHRRRRGMLTATTLAIFFVPVFFVILMQLFWVEPRRLSSDQAMPISTAVRMLEPGHHQ